MLSGTGQWTSHVSSSAMTRYKPGKSPLKMKSGREQQLFWRVSQSQGQATASSVSRLFFPVAPSSRPKSPAEAEPGRRRALWRAGSRPGRGGGPEASGRARAERSRPAPGAPSAPAGGGARGKRNRAESGRAMAAAVGLERLLGAVELRCTCCLQFFRDPVRLSGCTHSFCRPCILQYRAGKQRAACPLCREGFELKDLRPNRELAALVSLIPQEVKDEELETGDELKPSGAVPCSDRSSAGPRPGQKVRPESPRGTPGTARGSFPQNPPGQPGAPSGGTPGTSLATILNTSPGS